MQPKDAAGPDPVDFAIGARVRARRRQLNLSQSELAAALGVSFQQVQKYERGVNRVSGSTLVATAAALDITVGWLVGEEGAGGQSDDVFRALSAAGALEMLQAYARIPGVRSRAALLALAQQMAAAEDAA
ncbi:helix-turn-helix transcriptional regulator [Phenylobacterium sp.]|jgi:transcriptional regulator with XRE-family HTH domain|uniref:helix-turn-helix domain-containing protein n=1 Tax=Phenylobacterium sp. TaxID=1871053 RepID=UPI002F3E335C